MSARLPRDRRGMTLVEVIVSLLIAGLVLSAAMAFFQQQGRALSAGTGQMMATQNHRYAISTLRRDLRTAGSGVYVREQPSLVYAGEDVVAFNADYLSDRPGDEFALYTDPDAPAGEVGALTPAQRITLPGTTFGYPDTLYARSGTNSPAETLIFFFAPDATTPRGDDFVLYRQVNAGPPGVVARNLLRTGGRPFFEYLRVVTAPGQPTRLVPVPRAGLPLVHRSPVHGGRADTGRLAWADSVRAVRVTLTSTSGHTGPRETRRATTRLIQLPNLGQMVLQVCGARPSVAGTLRARDTLVAGSSAVSVSWRASADEPGGERDIMSYVVWRRSAAGDPWGDPVGSIAAGRADYAFVDTDVVAGRPYFYAVAAQDCTPNLSELAAVGPVIAPFP